jgi:hypothetical protein
MNMYRWAISNSKKPGCLAKNPIFQVTKHVLREGLWFFGGHVGKLIHVWQTSFYKNRIFKVTKHVLREGLWFFGGHVGKLIHVWQKIRFF